VAEGDAPAGRRAPGADLGTPPRRRLLLAGSYGPERIPVRPDPGIERWFEPLHVRDPAVARGRISSQVEVGADVVVAPTWLTHRRALLPVGETRQARAWTAAAVAVGRDAIEVGLEWREQARTRETEAADGPADASRDSATERRADVREPGPPRPPPRLAGALPALDEGPELDTGRLLPREAATARDIIDQAGLLADARPDLLLIEGQRDIAEIHLAAEAAAETGLPVWVALTGLDADALTPDAIVDLSHELTSSLRVERVLLPPLRPSALPEIPTDSGGLVRGSDEVAAWLEHRVDVIGILDGATPTSLRPLRAAIDDAEHAELEHRRSAEDRWWSHVRQAAAMAPGGRGLWLGPLPVGHGPDHRLPEGFDWLTLESSDVPGLPESHFRLVVDAIGWSGPGPGLARLLDRGGVVALRGGAFRGQDTHLRVLLLDDEADPPLVIARRED
jgi:hypothetical protein